MKVLILHTAPPEVSAIAPDRHVWEFDLADAARAVGTVLPDAAIVRVRGEPREVLDAIDQHAPDVIYNLCEAPLGRPDREAHIAALFEWAGVRFTGAGSETLALCRRKDRVNRLLALAGVPVPRDTGFPCIVKPASEDGSAAIGPDSICDDEEAVARAQERIAGPAIVQEFLEGREFAVSLWGGCEPEHVSIGETVFQGGLRLITYAAKWDVESDDFRNSPLRYDTDLSPALRCEVIAAARAAWRVVGGRGSMRIDIRLDVDGRPRVLDLNPNPESSPEVGIHRAVGEAGWTWERFVKAQLAWA